MILDRIDELTDDELARGVYHLLYSALIDRETYAKMQDRRLIPILAAILEADGRPTFIPSEDLPKEGTDRVMTSAVELLGLIVELSDQEAIEVLITVLDHDNDRVKLAAAVALGRLGATAAAPKVVDLAERMIAQGEIGAVSRLAQALAAIGGEEARTCLAEFIARNRETDNKHVRYAVALAEASVDSIRRRLEEEER